MLLLTVPISVGPRDIVLSVNYALNEKTDEHNIVVKLKKRMSQPREALVPRSFPVFWGARERQANVNFGG
jgi:hypothetical protein